MKRASDQLPEETAFPNLAAFLRSGGKLVVGEDLSFGTFAYISKGNQSITVHATYRDFTAVLNEMEASAKKFLNNSYEHIDHRKVNE